MGNKQDYKINELWNELKLRFNQKQSSPAPTVGFNHEGTITIVFSECSGKVVKRSWSLINWEYDNTLSWNQHVNKITARANKVLGLISRTCGGFHDPATLKSLYCSLVCSQLEYCSVVWSQRRQKRITAIEWVQRRATKFILKSNVNSAMKSV